MNAEPNCQKSQKFSEKEIKERKKNFPCICEEIFSKLNFSVKYKLK